MGLAEEAEGVTDALGMTVGGGDRERIGAFGDERADVSEQAGTVDFAVRRAGHRDGDADAETEVGIAGRADVGAGFFGDALDVAQREQATQAVLGVDDEELVLADVFGEQAIGFGNRVFPQILLEN